MAWTQSIPGLVIPKFEADPERLAALHRELFTVEGLIERLDRVAVCPSPSAHDEYIPLWQEDRENGNPCPYCGVERNVLRRRT